MVYVAPEAVVTVAAFGNQTVDVWIPFQIPAEGVENHEESRSEIHGLVLFEKHT